MVKKRIRGILKVKVLGIIIKNKSIHGYGIYRELVNLIGDLSTIEKPSIGTIYRILNELVKEGLLRKTIVQNGRRKIIFYEATDKGISEFLRISVNFLERVSTGLKLVLPTITTLQGLGYNTETVTREIERLKKILTLDR